MSFARVDENITSLLITAMARKLQFQRLTEKAVLPKRAHNGDAGYDLFSAVSTTVPSRGTKLVHTNICVRLPEPGIEGYSVYGRVAERSGLAINHSIAVGGGVIDRNYTGDIGVILHNHSDADFTVKYRDKIAQLVVELCMNSTVEEVNDIAGSVTERGTRGLGSTGV